jgi:hypothetical protein
MAFAEDILGGNLVAVAVLGATAIVLPKVLPSLPLPVRSVIKSGVTLFLESEAEAEGGIIDSLAENALKAVLQTMSSSGPADDRRAAATAAVEHFKHTAHTRARRYGHDQHDRSARYARHVAALRRKLERAQSHRQGGDHAALSAVLAALDKHDSPQPEESSHGTA